MGDVARWKQEAREVEMSTRQRSQRREWWSSFLREFRQAARALLREPGFSLPALLTLALGIGATVGMFTVVDAVMLRPLPYPRADRLVQVLPGEKANIALDQALTKGAPSLLAASGLASAQLTLTGAGEPAAVTTRLVDAAFFRTVGVEPALGRAFTPAERDPDRSDVVILSYGLWQQRFGGDRSVLGRRLQLDGVGHRYRTVVGVMPRGFVSPLAPHGMRVQAWVPLSVAPGRTVVTDSTWYLTAIIGRLQPGATLRELSAEVRTTMARLHQRYPGIIDGQAVRNAGATGLLAGTVGNVRGPLWVLLAAVGLVLLLACANLMNLLLARGERRRGELAVRAALGASRARLVRKQLIESTVLALVGGAAGVALARGILTVLRVGEASGLPRAGSLELDPRVLGFAVVVSLLSVLGFGLLPALRATAGDLRGDLAADGRSAGVTRSGRRLGLALVASEVALALVVITGAGLLLGSLRALRAVNPGLDAGDVLAVQLAPPEQTYAGQRAVAFYDEVLHRLAGLPRVRRVGAIQLLPFTTSNWLFPYLAEGHPPRAGMPLPSANFRVVTPGYFGAVGVPLLSGRDIRASDDARAPAVGLINQAMADKLWPGQDAVGKMIKLFGSEPFRVVGVVGNVHQRSLSQPPQPEMYRPLAQFPVTSMVVMLRTAVAPASLSGAVRAVIHQVRNDVPITDLRPLTEVLGESLARQRFFTGVLAFFGLLALGLGAVGVYGVTAYHLGARHGEFGLRMALGATQVDVVRGAFVSGLAPITIGLVVGLIGVFASTRLLAGLLFGVGAVDPPIVATAVTVLGAVAAIAVWIPVWRASRVEPSSALRTE